MWKPLTIVVFLTYILTCCFIISYEPLTNRIFRPLPAISTSVVTLDNSNNSAMIIFASYYYYKPDDIVGLQIIGFSYCRNADEKVELLVANQSFRVRSDILNSGCPTEDSISCFWLDYAMYTEIPASLKRSSMVQIVQNGQTTPLRVVESASVKKRLSGLEACVAPLYYYNHWIRVIEFMEIYRQQGVSHVYVYVSSVSRLVYDMLKVYQSKRLLTIVEWPELPRIDNTTDYVFRLGQNTAIMDCVRRSKSKFVAIVDLDDYIVVRNETLLDFVTREEQRNTNISAFTFEMSLVHQDPRNGSLNNWQGVSFDGLEKGVPQRDQSSTKPIVVPDKLYGVSPHTVYRQWKIPGSDSEYQILQVKRTVGRAYHARYAYAAYHDTKIANIRKKIPLFPNGYIDNLKSNYTKIMRQFSQTHPDLTTPAIADIMEQCNEFKWGFCQMPYVNCRDAMKDVDDWFFFTDASVI